MRFARGKDAYNIDGTSVGRPKRPRPRKLLGRRHRLEPNVRPPVRATAAPPRWILPRDSHCHPHGPSAVGRGESWIRSIHRLTGLTLLVIGLGLPAPQPVAALSFAAPYLSFETGEDPHWIQIADLNADGHLDLVTANFGNTISVLLGN